MPSSSGPSLSEPLHLSSRLLVTAPRNSFDHYAWIPFSLDPHLFLSHVPPLFFPILHPSYLYYRFILGPSSSPSSLVPPLSSRVERVICLPSCAPTLRTVACVSMRTLNCNFHFWINRSRTQADKNGMWECNCSATTGEIERRRKRPKYEMCQSHGRQPMWKRPSG